MIGRALHYAASRDAQGSSYMNEPPLKFTMHNGGYEHETVEQRRAAYAAHTDIEMLTYAVATARKHYQQLYSDLDTLLSLQAAKGHSTHASGERIPRSAIVKKDDRTLDAIATLSGITYSIEIGLCAAAARKRDEQYRIVASSKPLYMEAAFFTCDKAPPVFRSPEFAHLCSMCAIKVRYNSLSKVIMSHAPPLPSPS